MQKGFSLVEVILSIALLAILTTTFVGAYLYGQESTVLSGARNRAVAIAEEGVEAVRNIRDADFANLTDGTHGLALSGNEWVLSGSSDTTDIFTRAVNISTVDANHKDVVSSVNWQQNAVRNGSVSISARLSYWMQVAETFGDWSNPVQATSTDVSGTENGWKIQAQDDYAYLVRMNGDPDFVVFDISDPDNSTPVASLALPGGPRNIFVEGDYAYVASTQNNQELQIIDISNPSSPSVEGTYNAPGGNDMYGVYVVGDYAYLGRDSSGQDEFYVVDVSNPSSPSLEGSLEIGSDANEVYVSGNYVYVATDDNSGELYVVDISSPTSPSIDTQLDLTTNDNAETVTGFGNTVIIGRSTNDGYIHTIDVSSPGSPSLLGTYTADDDVRDISLGNSNQYLFVATDRNPAEFQVLDISTLTSPTLLGSLDLPADINGVAYSENHDRAFVAGDGDEFIVIEPQ